MSITDVVLLLFGLIGITALVVIVFIIDFVLRNGDYPTWH